MSTFDLVFYFSFLIFVARASFSSDPYNRQQLDKVLDLPGQCFNVSFASYSGYVTTNKESGRALFYWFFEGVEDPSSKPLVLWLNGGPGCSSVAFGLAEEIGPFHVEKDGKNLYLNPYSWNEVGVGFSYSNTSSDLLSHGDKRTAAENLEFLLQWFGRFRSTKKMTSTLQERATRMCVYFSFVLSTCRAESISFPSLVRRCHLLWFVVMVRDRKRAPTSALVIKF